MSSKTVKFNKKTHEGNYWMTGHLLDLINLKQTDIIKIQRNTRSACGI